jgi:large subunit ribosomal protein L18
VFRSLKHIYAQVVDDAAGRTLLSVSTLTKELKGKSKSGDNKEAATLIGLAVAKKCIEKGIKNVVFDRSGYLYHGRIKALADAARKEGLQF